MIDNNNVTDAEDEPSLQYMIFQYGMDAFYIGVVDEQALNRLEPFFNIMNPLSIRFNDNGNYVITMLGNGLGDSRYYLNLSKDKVLAVFTPADDIVSAYDTAYQRYLNNVKASQEAYADNTPHIEYYEVGTKQ
jgi:hypothetical protein